jgi:hypothetical protein
VPTVSQPSLSHILELLKRNGNSQVVITLQSPPDWERPLVNVDTEPRTPDQADRCACIVEGFQGQGG